MSLTDTLTLESSSGANTTWNLLFKDATQTKRINTAGTLSEPSQLVIKHTSSGTGANIVDRHLISATQSKLDTLGVTRTATVNMTIAVPRNTVITQTIVADLISAIVALVTDGSFSATTGMLGQTNLTQLLRNES